MPKKTRLDYLTLWEQWLQRMSGSYSDEIKDDINRFEIIELLAENISTDRLLCSRIGTIFHHFFPAEIITIYDISTHDLVFSTLPRSEEKKLIGKVSPVILQSHVAQAKINLPILLKGRTLVLRHLYQLEVSSPANHFHINFLTIKPLEDREMRFITTVQTLLDLRHHNLQTTKNLSNQNERLKAVTQHLSEGLIIVDKNYQVESWNRPMQQITGYSVAEAIGHHLSTIFRRTDALDWLQTLAESKSNDSGQIFRQEFQILTKRNKPRWVNLSGSFLLNEKNQLEQIILLIRDVSAMKELEQRKNEFISIATHELRTPITVVKGYLSLIEKNKEGLSEKHQSYIRQTIKASDRLVKLAEDLLQVVHIEEEQLKFAIQPMLVYPILKKVISDFTPKAERKGLLLKMELADRKNASPRRDDPKDWVKIMGDPVRIEQIFANLVDNALKYTAQGSVTIRRILETNRQTKLKEITIEITDTGIGINKNDLETIFDKFRRTDSAHRSRESGAGLGLFIVKSFVEKQHGRISVMSRPRRGTTFRVSFPEATMTLVRRRKHDQKRAAR